MSTFINNDITNDGRLLLARAQLGKRINFTRIVMGDGYLPPDTAIRDMKSVVNPVVSVPISKMKVNADGTAVIGGVFSNADIDKEFFYRELSLYAEGESDTPGEYNPEVLYCYGNAGDFAERITPIGGSSIIDKVIDIVTAIGTTKNITATIVRTTAADEIGFDDSKIKLGAASLQEAIEILASNSENRIPVTIISEDEPTEPCEIWLKPMGGVSIQDAIGGGPVEVLQPINITGAHIGDEPPEDTSKIWFKPMQQG